MGIELLSGGGAVQNPGALFDRWEMMGQEGVAMPDRETALRQLDAGDIFHAQAANGASLVCLVTALDDGRILARRIHTQENLQFDRRTGIETGPAQSRIDSVMPLPPNIHRLFLAMDRRYGAILREVAQGHRLEDAPERLKLTDAERRALLYLDAHYAANPL